MAAISSYVNIIKKYLDTGRDFVQALSGFTGEGKSTIAIQIAKKGDRHFDMDKNIIYTRKELIDKINNIKEYSYIIIDEAINVLFARDFAKGEQKELIKLLNVCRYRHLCLIFNIPNFWDLDCSIRDSRIRVWGYVASRGECYLFEPDKNPFTRDKWHRKDNEKLLYKWNEGVRPSVRTKNFLDCIEFEKLSDEEQKLYEELRDRKRREASENPLEEEINPALLNKLLFNERNKYIIKMLSMEFPVSKVAEIFGLSETTIKNIKLKHREEKIRAVANELREEKEAEEIKDGLELLKDNI